MSTYSSKRAMISMRRTKDGTSALMMHLKRVILKWLNWLIRNGADVNANNIDGYTALMYAAYKGIFKSADLLIKNKADVNARDKDGGQRCDLLQSGQNDIMKCWTRRKIKE